eukprot:scaffold5127_cov64-Phaeocystis_antarctica.AAC.1
MPARSDPLGELCAVEDRAGRADAVDVEREAQLARRLRASLRGSLRLARLRRTAGSGGVAEVQAPLGCRAVVEAAREEEAPARRSGDGVHPLRDARREHSVTYPEATPRLRRHSLGDRGRHEGRTRCCPQQLHRLATARLERDREALPPREVPRPAGRGSGCVPLLHVGVRPEAGHALPV